jgi:membrane protein YqaA with SNARE-associated domain
MGLVVEYAVLFGWSFLAATVLPLGSEVAFACRGASPGSILMPIAVATVGNSLGAVTTYWLGAKADDVAAERGALSSRARRAAELLKRHGQPIVFFSWIPILGDALVAAAGAAKMRPGPFAAWMVAGKALRYAVLAWSVRAVG